MKARAATLRISGTSSPSRSALRDAQARLAKLIALGRTSSRRPPFDRTRTDPLLARADASAKAAASEEALATLDAAERLEPADPRVSFRAGEIL